LDCKEYERSLDPDSEEYKLLEYMQQAGFKQCPKCKKYVKNNEGPCSNCGANKNFAPASKCVNCGVDVTGVKVCDNCKSHCCVECNKTATGSEFVVVNDKLYHRNCFTGEIKCIYCNGPIIGTLRRVLDQNYHPKCFICTGCSKLLENEFTDINAWPWCKDCMETVEFKKAISAASADKEREAKLKRLREQEELLKNAHWEVTYGSGAGFVVDPKTGQKRYTTKT